MERFENIREFKIQLQINEGHLLSDSPASQNGLMIYEWLRDSKVLKWKVIYQLKIFTVSLLKWNIAVSAL